MSSARLARRIVLAAAALAAAVLAAELVVRASGSSSEPALFVPAGPGRLRISPHRAEVGTLEIAAQPDRLRIVWLGDSTVAGVPWEPELTPPRWLQWILDSRGLRAEVIGLAGQGFDAARLAALLEEVLALHPDVVVVTTGHNEYLTVGPALKPRWWQSLQVVALLQAAMNPEPEPPGPGETPDHAAVTARFAQSLAAMSAACAADGVPLLFTAPVSNLADMPPVLGGPAPDGNADAEWQAGRAARALGDAATAHAAFARARDLDRWPHRATTRLCEAVRERAPHLVPVDVAFDHASPDGLPGADLFIDHCHPLPVGQRLMALAVADAIEDLRVADATGRRGQAPPLEAGLTDLGAEDQLLARGRAQVGRVFAGLALLRDEPGPLAEAAARLLDDPTLLPHVAPAELAVSRTLLAVARHDAAQARAQLAAAAARPESLAKLRTLHDRYRWVARAFQRAGVERP